MVVKPCEVCGRPFEARGRAKYCSDECRLSVLREQRKEASATFRKAHPDRVKAYQRQYWPGWYQANAELMKEFNAKRDKEVQRQRARLARSRGDWKVKQQAGSDRTMLPKDEAALARALRKELESLGLR